MSSDHEEPGPASDREPPTADHGTTVSLGDVDPARSRHAGRRSGVLVDGDLLAVGTADGRVRRVDADTGAEQWTTTETDGSVVSLALTDRLVVAGERGETGQIWALDRATGEVRWRHHTAHEVGEPAKATRFFLPFVVDVVAADDRIYVAARRYERDRDRRRFESVVYAFTPAGDLRWRYRTDASPIALAADEDRLAVAYNRCPGEHADGLIVLDAVNGTERLTWDPPGGGQRRVGDVAVLPDGFAVASHADYRGYRLDATGGVRWRVDLATTIERDGERLYAYPNHVHATASGVVFVTGNTYPEEGRDTDARHPREHTAFGVDPDGAVCWTDTVGGFAADIAADGELVAVPGAQNFRTRDAATHGVSTFDVREGPVGSRSLDGVAAAATVDGDTVAAVEEPVAYHDAAATRGTYRLHVWDQERE